MTLLSWSNVVALGKFVPLLSIAFQKKPQAPEDLAHARRVYNFKKHGTHAERFRADVERVKAHFLCDAVVSVPSSIPAINHLQTAFGSQIERKVAVLARKTGHKKPLAADYAESYVIHANRIAGRRVLLVDDVCTSGATLEHFTGALQAAGFEVVPMALAFDHKLPTTPGPEIPDNVTLATPATTAANTIEQEVERMAGLGAPESMIADALGISVRSIQRKYSAITRRARAYRRLAILALQMEAAKKLQVAMLIWLGKQELGQVDTPAAAEVKKADTTLHIVRMEPSKMLPAPTAEA